MNPHFDHDTQVEPERYEFFETPRYQFELDRREFVKLLGGGIVVLLLVSDESEAQQRGGRGGGNLPQELSAWVRVGDDGRVSVYSGKVEIGQNTRTSLAQAAAEELRVPVDAVDVIMADTDRVPFDGGTVGSASTPRMIPQIRRAAATLRELLIDLAAEQWKVDRAAVRIDQGKLTHSATGQTLSLGQLAAGKALTKTVNADVRLTPPSEWKTLGTSVPKQGGHDIVTGKHRYTPDISLPGMQYGKVLRPDRIGAKLVNVDTSAAAAMDGVSVVRDGDFVGVVAPTARQAELALAAIKAEWSPSTLPSSDEFLNQMRQTHAREKGGDARPTFEQGSIEKGLAESDHQLRASYPIAYIAHAPLETRAAVAVWEDDKLSVWTGTQRPFGVRTELSSVFRIPAEQIRVVTPDMGSGYGGKHQGDATVEAARLAKGARKPVKLVWTRDEEFTWAYFRPAGLIEVAAGVRKDGTITAWDYHNYNSGASAIRTLYDIPNQRIAFHQARSPLRQGSYRGLAATANHFGRECAMDDLARLVEQDPLTFRLKNLRDARLRAVLEAAAERFGWSQAKGNSERGIGIAGGSEKGSYVATCAQVAIDRSNGSVRVERLVTAFECGAIINPDMLRNQVEGAEVMALGGALFEAIQFADGQIVNGRFSRYRVPRFSDMPKLETVLVNRTDLPSAGAGETPIVAVAPAIGNAILQATGVRLASMPMATATLKA